VTGDPEGVIHSWFIPSFGVQEYAVPGRLNESWFRVEREGTYYGECNQICGVNHAFMPIAVKAVSKDDFQKWLAEAKKAAALEQPAQDRAVLAAAGRTRPDSAPAGN
jgi:cytochrome c oxidase subunit 2